MNIDHNKPPAGKVLPKTFNGKEPVRAGQVVIGDDSAEPAYKTLCADGTYEVIPLSAFKDVAAPAQEGA